MKNYEKISKMNSNKIETYEGGVGYRMSFEEILAEFFSLGLLNGNFYQSQKDVLENAKDVFEKALKECPEFATKCAIYGNNVNSLKLVPTVWLVYLSKLEDKSLFKSAFPKIIRNPKMLHDFMEICRKGGIRDGLGRSTKKVINEWMGEKLNEYQVSRNKGKLVDVVRITRPNNKEPEFQNYMKYLIKDELTFDRAIGLKGVIGLLEEGIMDEEVIYLIEQNRLQLEELKHSTNNLSLEDRQVLYAHMYEGLNYTALVLNLVALERVYATETREISKYGSRGYFSQQLVVETDIPNDVIDMVCKKIEDIDMYRKSNMLPFALITAERMVVTPEFKVAIGNTIKKVAGETFKLDKDTSLMIGVDTSYSMNSDITDALTCMDVATLFGAMIKKSHTNSNVFAIASKIEKVELRKQDNVFEMARQIEKTEVGCGTYFEQLMKEYNGEKYIILLTDSMSADNLESAWMKKKKPEGAKLIVWQLEAYQTKVSNDPSVVYVAGYSDRLLGLIKNIIEGKNGQIEEINKVEI